MQNKERMMEIQMVFSKRHIIVFIAIIVYLAVAISSGYSTTYVHYVPCLVICVVMLVDMFLAYKNFFHKYYFLLVTKIIELTIVGAMLQFDDSQTLLWAINYITIISFSLLAIEFAFVAGSEDTSQVVGTTFLTLIPFVYHLIRMLAGLPGTVMGLIQVILVIIISAVVFFSLFSYMYFVNKYYMESIFAKDRLLDSAKEKYDKIGENTKSIVKINEDLGVKKYELEQANNEVRRVNQETNLQNRIMEVFFGSKDPAVVFPKVEALLKENYGVDFAGILFSDHNESIYDDDLLEIMSPKEKEELEEKWVNKSFVIDHNGKWEDALVINDVAYEDYPFLESAEIKSVAALSVPTAGDYIAIYLIMSKEYNLFTQYEQFFKTFFNQIVVMIDNLALYKQLENLSRIDGLTGLYNRRYLNIYFEKNYINASVIKPVCAMLMDIDKFKSINDTYGHLFGDQALKVVSSIINEEAALYHGKAFRYGGEEFVVLIDDIDSNQGFKIAEEIRERIAATPITYNKLTINAQVSIGITAYPGITTDITHIIDRADKAMYYSKEHGRNQTTLDTGDVL